ncbi:MAG: bifunctional precorrin-2 dehydrogenase/sirohydrochlorin ferrochelatase [Proteobacteria bacterium]|nr:bifunctional precorrin-2 dehydrogenase/sirohydrochlorin ferrochelatase [Pseudomonadota bacterium]
MTAPRPSREQLRFLPLALSTAELHALVVGGGREALLKTTMLCRYGARVTVCSAEPSAALREQPGITLLLRPFDEGMLAGVTLVYACGEDREQNRAIGAMACARGLLVNVVDDPTHCDFVTPALFQQGEMSVAVSSNGQSVARSIAWRNAIRALFDPAPPAAEAPRATTGKVWLVGWIPSC